MIVVMHLTRINYFVIAFHVELVNLDAMIIVVFLITGKSIQKQYFLDLEMFL